MEIIIVESKLQFKSPQLGFPTKAIVEHYYGRRVKYLVNGEEKMATFKPDEMPIDIDEYEMIEIIKVKELALVSQKDNSEN